MDRRSFELVEPLDLEPAVARARGEHDAARLDPLAGGQHHMARVVAAFELHRLVGDRDFDPELLRLAEGPAHQGHARNAGREAEVILDPRRSARLAAERAAIDGEHRQTFGARVDGGREAGGAGTNDHHVIKPVGDQSARPVRHSARAGPRSDCAANCRRDRARSEVLQARPGNVDQRLRAAIIGRVEASYGWPLRRRKLTSRSTSPLASCADDDRSGAGLDQADPAKDKRPHHALAEIGLGDQRGAQPIRRDRQGFDIGQRRRVDEIGPAGQLREFAHEIAALVRDDVVALAAFVPA